MTTPDGPKAVRRGSVTKRAAILAAARELFVREGFERTSMDAVAAAAQVSKRTVYDYYGDKRRLLIGVVEDAAESLVGKLRAAIGAHLADDAGITTAADLERALTALADELGTSLLASTEYAVFFKLLGEQPLPELADHPLALAPEEAIAERLAHYDAAGILDAPEPLLAADHFNALTVLLAYNDQPRASAGAPLDPARIRRVMADGVHAFMRAYARRPGPPPG